MPTSTYENDDYAAMLSRMVRAYGRRIADGDPTDLATALGIMAELESAVSGAVAGMREQHGYSWADIAAHTGTSRQAAQQRWGRR